MILIWDRTTPSSLQQCLALRRTSKPSRTWAGITRHSKTKESHPINPVYQTNHYPIQPTDLLLVPIPVWEAIPPVLCEACISYLYHDFRNWIFARGLCTIFSGARSSPCCVRLGSCGHQLRSIPVILPHPNLELVHSDIW